MESETGIGAGERKDIAESLAHLLADTYTLYTRTQGSHWNVTGPLFPQRHELFEKQYRELAEAVDEIAERIRALGHEAPGSLSQLSRMSSIPDGPAPSSPANMLRDLIVRHEALARTARSFIRLAEQAHDHATADLLTERMRAHEKTAWMLRSVDTTSPPRSLLAPD
jgi:starvation-inducible DNA-binding protein